MIDQSMSDDQILSAIQAQDWDAHSSLLSAAYEFVTEQLRPLEGRALLLHDTNERLLPPGVLTKRDFERKATLAIGTFNAANQCDMQLEIHWDYGGRFSLRVH